MTAFHIIRTWKNNEYHISRSAEQPAERPENPAGLQQLAELDLDSVSGGHPPDRNERVIHAEQPVR
ncbi:MAG TPA: mersacidin/lichenicidin family type 2 lantibiotic [Herpetosiphonaceae bacterium]|nr:mersacidin/lichenicidin family type 2 lantibiotic [Herpetosiphonaceae bacterium]